MRKYEDGSIFPYIKLTTGINSPADIYLIKVNNRNTITCEIYSKLTIKTLLTIKKLSSFLTLNRFKDFSNVSIDDFEQVSFG